MRVSRYRSENLTGTDASSTVRAFPVQPGRCLGDDTEIHCGVPELMPLTSKIGHLRPAEYQGYTNHVEQDPASPFETRLTAVDYSGECEVFATTCHVFTELWPSIPMPIRSVAVAPGRVMADYTGGQLNALLDDVDEKVTQWASVAARTQAAANEFESYLSTVQGTRFSFSDRVRALECDVEHYCFKIISILDLYARIARVFNRRSPPKFGQQVAATLNGRFWDNGYQDFLSGCGALSELRHYRNAVGHEVSLKLRPVQKDGAWRAVLVRARSDFEGLLLCPFLAELQEEFVGYARFFDKYFAAKAGGLDELASNNSM